MNPKFWIFAAALSTACFGADDKEEEEEEEEEQTEPSSEPSSEASSEPSSEPSTEPTILYITSGYSGTAEVVPGTSFEGTETYVSGYNDAPTGAVDTEIFWTSTGTPVESPAECVDCAFAFDIQLTFDAGASTDPQGSGGDASFGYALGTSDYGANTLFYGAEGSWSPWIYDGNSATDGAGVEHAQVVNLDGTTFTYDSIVVDYYYAY